MRVVLCLLALLCSSAYASELTVAPGGVTVHGGPIDPTLADQMPNRVTSDGRVVYHPTEVSLRVRSESRQLYGSYMKDCFGESAEIIGAGWITDFGSFSPGVMVALFVRKTHYFIDPDNGRLTYPDRMPLAMVYNDHEYTPLLMLTASYRFHMLGHPFEWLLGTNYILTHTQLGASFDF